MFNDNFAMQSMMMHTTLMQQNENMRTLQNMLEKDNLRLFQHNMSLLQQQQMQEQEMLREIYEEEDRKNGRRW